jgi:hypothetical protein
MSAYNIKNYCDYDWTSNNINCLKITKRNRRFFAVEASTYYLGNADYFTAFYEEIERCPRALRVIAQYLMDFDISKVVPSGRFQKDMPVTELMQEMMEHNEDYMKLFLEDREVCFGICTQTKAVKDRDVISTIALFERWKRFCERCGIENQYNLIGFSSRFARYIVKAKIEYFEKYTASKAFSGYYVNKDDYKEKISYSLFVEDEVESD